MLVWCQGFLKLHLQRCWVFPCAPSKIGNKVAVSPLVQQKPSSVLPNVILKSCKNSLREVVRPNPAVQGTLRVIAKDETHSQPRSLRSLDAAR